MLEDIPISTEKNVPRARLLTCMRCLPILRRGLPKLRTCGRARSVGMRCRCGAQLEQWVSPADAEADLLRSALLALTTENQVGTLSLRSRRNAKSVTMLRCRTCHRP